MELVFVVVAVFLLFLSILAWCLLLSSSHSLYILSMSVFSMAHRPMHGIMKSQFFLPESFSSSEFDSFPILTWFFCVCSQGLYMCWLSASTRYGPFFFCLFCCFSSLDRTEKGSHGNDTLFFWLHNAICACFLAVTCSLSFQFLFQCSKHCLGSCFSVKTYFWVMSQQQFILNAYYCPQHPTWVESKCCYSWQSVHENVRTQPRSKSMQMCIQTCLQNTSYSCGNCIRCRWDHWLSSIQAHIFLISSTILHVYLIFLKQFFPILHIFFAACTSPEICFECLKINFPNCFFLLHAFTERSIKPLLRIAAGPNDTF